MDCPSRLWRHGEAPLPSEPADVRNWHLCGLPGDHDGLHECTSKLCDQIWNDATAMHWSNGPVVARVQHPCLSDEAYRRALNSI